MKKVAVAMSGGVDSSLSAAILKNSGYEVFGITMKLKDAENFPEIEDSRRVAEHLKIKHYIADFREDFFTEVEKYFVNEYLSGRTPNPCVMCNKKIKFGKLFDFAKSLGADFLATGHYAKIVFEDNRYKLKKAPDTKKDQSYVLYNLTPELLSRIIFPLAEMSKTETRKIAEEMNLPVAHKKDSQEICFVPDDDYKNFILKFAGNSDALKPGEIVDTSGKVLGRHSGVANFTIGQRRGMGIAAENPLYVTELDLKNRRVIVGKSDEVFSKNLTAENVHWIYKPELPKKFSAKIRYGSRTAECTVNPAGEKIFVEFDEKQRAVTPGQSIVFYEADEVIGGGIIAEVRR